MHQVLKDRVDKLFQKNNICESQSSVANLDIFTLALSGLRSDFMDHCSLKNARKTCHRIAIKANVSFVTRSRIYVSRRVVVWAYVKT
jgi:hypothetical protein